MRLGHIGLNSLQALAKKELLKGATTCNLKFSKQYVLNKKTKVKFGIVIHHTEGLLGCVTLMFGVLPIALRTSVLYLFY